jgi:hypothetical protein
MNSALGSPSSQSSGSSSPSAHSIRATNQASYPYRKRGLMASLAESLSLLQEDGLIRHRYFYRTVEWVQISLQVSVLLIN